MPHRNLLWSATLVIGYYAWIFFMLQSLVPVSVVSITRGSAFALFIAGMIAGLWLKPSWGRWPVIILLGLMLWGTLGSFANYPAAALETALRVAKIAICARILYALVRADFDGVKPADVVSSPA